MNHRIWRDTASYPQDIAVFSQYAPKCYAVLKTSCVGNWLDLTHKRTANSNY